jgi:membrane associated rhomboid family serine protease
MLVPVLAITIFPFTKPDLFENSSAFVKRKWGKVPVITVIGSVTFLFLLWLIVASFLFPAVGGRIGPVILGTLIGFIISGLIVFYVARAYRMSKEGIDINWTFQSVPPI